MTQQKSNNNPWQLDVRVRERNLKAGIITEKDVEKHLAALPDLSDQADNFSTHQPALEQPELEDDDEEDEAEEGSAEAVDGT